MILNLLAEAAVQPDAQISGNWILAMVPVLASALALLLGKNHWKKQGASEAQQIGPQPFIVQMREEFATRRELEKLEQTVNAHVVEIKAANLTASNEMRGLFRETMTAMATQTETTNKTIERRHKSVSEEIAKVASGAYAGRQKIWEQVNAQREDVAGLKATKDVAAQIGKLADALAPQTKVQPTHSSN